jgi:adenosylcobinamide-phosphate synthase
MRGSRAFKLAAAFLLDAMAGDPENYPHPVRLMGRSIEFLEKRMRPEKPGEGADTYAGCILAGTVAGGTYLCARLVTLLPGKSVTGTLLMYTCLARKDLEISALRVAQALEDDDISGARDFLKALVGRDPERLDENGICRAAVESVAENFVDGILAPLLWAAVGGAPAALVFKAVSTLDSMVGHRDERYLHLGRCSAGMDDLAVFPAARVSIPLVAAAARFCGYDGGAALRIGFRDRLNHLSPNSAHAEAAFAGALGLKLGGPASYGGMMRELPEIGEGMWRAEPRHIREAVRLLNAASLLGLGLSMVVSGRGRR